LADDGSFLLHSSSVLCWRANRNVQGWYAVRRESRKLTWAFLTIAFFFLSAWSTMFDSRVYRFTFVDWPFFACATVTSFVSMISSTVFAFVCLRNYGKGLSQWSACSFLLFARGVSRTLTS
jgi:hypothetical protein